MPQNHLVLETLVLLLEAGEGANVLGGAAGRADGKLFVIPMVLFSTLLLMFPRASSRRWWTVGSCNRRPLTPEQVGPRLGRSSAPAAYMPPVI